MSSKAIMLLERRRYGECKSNEKILAKRSEEGQQRDMVQLQSYFYLL